MSAQDIASVLNRAADLIEPEGRWTQGGFARGKSGDKVDRYGRAAVCWCVLGAIDRARNGLYRTAAGWLLARHLNVGSVVDWNDAPERTQAEVVEALREAARLAASDWPLEGQGATSPPHGMPPSTPIEPQLDPTPRGEAS